MRKVLLLAHYNFLLAFGLHFFAFDLALGKAIESNEVMPTHRDNREQQASYQPNRQIDSKWWYDVVVFLRHTPSYLDPSSGVFCTGLLVDPRIILTAGHCQLAMNQGQYYAQRVDEFGNTVQESLLLPGGAIIHPEYLKRQYQILKDIKAAEKIGIDLSFNDTFNYAPDLAFVSLAEPMKGGVFLDLARYIVEHRPYSSFFSFGPQHKYPSLDVIDAKLSSVSHKNRSTNIHENSIGLVTTQPQETKICKGDSGGPLFGFDPKTQKFGLVGLVVSISSENQSGSIENCSRYANADLLFDQKAWLMETLNELRLQFIVTSSIGKHRISDYGINFEKDKKDESPPPIGEQIKFERLPLPPRSRPVTLPMPPKPKPSNLPLPPKPRPK